MEKINSHYDHLHDQLFFASSAPNSFSSSSPAPNSSTFMRSNDYRFSSHSEATSKENDLCSSASYAANNVNNAFHPHMMMAQNLGFHQWPEISNIVPDNCPRTFTDMLVNGNSSSSMPTAGEDLYPRPISSHTAVTKSNDLSSELSEKLILRTLSSSSRMDGGMHQFLFPIEDEFRLCSRGLGNSFSQIHPTINLPSPNSQPLHTATSSPLECGNNWQTFDLLSNGRIPETDVKPAGESTFSSLLRESLIPDFGVHQMKESSSRPETGSFERMSLSSPNTMEAKRPSSSINEPNASHLVAAKKTRTETRSSSCPPMKVRKEKLGDRIAALQQLVAPFGKTDTASVLMEAIGYINFLQNQVQTLSVPYMKLSSQNSSRSAERGSRNEVLCNDEEPRRDLRSRGLCLVPLSCMSYITNDMNAGNNIWSPQDFGGGI